MSTNGEHEAADGFIGTKYPEIFAMLGAPFEEQEVKSRTQAGRTFSYVTARTVMNRLDNVLGPENWWEEFTPNANSVICRLTIRLPDGSTLTKSDAGGYAGMADSGDDDKSGYSDGSKRAAVKFGVGRYLYQDGVPTFVSERTGLPGPAIPLTEQAERATTRTPDQSPQPRQDAARQSLDAPRREPDREPARPQNGQGGPPRTGKALFAWTKDMEQKHEVQLLKYLNSWAQIQEFPGRMIDFTPEQVRLAHAEAVRKLEFVKSADHGDAYEQPAA